MNPRNAAHLCDVAGTTPSVCPEVIPSDFKAGVDTAICAMFFANRSLSPWSNFSCRFIAPGRLFMLFRRMMLTWSFASWPAALSCAGESSSGSAAASESRVATSFLFGRRLLGFLDDDFVIFDIRAACLMCRLSFLVDGKSGEPEVEDLVRWEEDEDAFLKADLRGLGALLIGAWDMVSRYIIPYSWDKCAPCCLFTGSPSFKRANWQESYLASDHTECFVASPALLRVQNFCTGSGRAFGRPAGKA
jgi:hypothetical protein